MASAVSAEDFSNLQLLLKAPSKDAVREVCVHSHRGPSRQLSEGTAAKFSISASQASQLVQSLHALSHHVVFYNLTSPEQILALFPESFHSNLKNLITKILLENSATWRTEALSNQNDVHYKCSTTSLQRTDDISRSFSLDGQLLYNWEPTQTSIISLPQLKEVDWRVDLVTSSESVSRMAVPTCLLQLKMEDSCHRGDEAVSTVTVELSRESVDTMLDGLGRIRDQLAAVAGK